MKPEFIIKHQGRDFVLYSGLLDAAHSDGLKSILTNVVQIPGPENGHVAIVQAVVETAKGTFSGIGDASQENVNRMILPHMLRMAETRAKARALRDAINVGVTAFEELGGPEHDASEAPRQLRPSGRTATPNIPDPEGEIGPNAGNTPASPKQLQTIQRMARASGKPIPTDNLTRAEASEIISNLIGEMDSSRNEVPAEFAQDTRRMSTANRVEQVRESQERNRPPTMGTAQSPERPLALKGAGFITEPQIRLISRLLKDLKEPMPPDINELSVRDASAKIEELKFRAGQG